MQGSTCSQLISWIESRACVLHGSQSHQEIATWDNRAINGKTPLLINGERVGLKGLITTRFFLFNEEREWSEGFVQEPVSREKGNTFIPIPSYIL